MLHSGKLWVGTEAAPRSSVFQSLGLSVSCMQTKIGLDSGSHLDRKPGLPNRRQFLCPKTDAWRSTGYWCWSRSHAPQTTEQVKMCKGFGEWVRCQDTWGMRAICWQNKRKSSLTSSHKWTNNWKIQYETQWGNRQNYISEKLFTTGDAVNC